MATDDAGDHDEVFHLEGGIPVFNPRLNQVERKQAEAETRDEDCKKEQLRLDRRMMYFTAALVACSLLSALVSGYQAHVASISAAAAKSTADTAARTLAEIQKSGTDTHTLAEAAGKQATNMERLATVATGQADTANQSMYIGQRAWVFPQDVYTETPQTILSLPFFACDKAADHTFRFARHSRTIVTIARGVGYWDSHFLTARLDPVSKAKMS